VAKGRNREDPRGRNREDPRVERIEIPRDPRETNREDPSEKWCMEPQEYHRILILGSVVMYHKITNEPFDHAALIVIDFTADPIMVKCYDPGRSDHPKRITEDGSHCIYKEEMVGIRKWLLKRHNDGRKVCLWDVRRQPTQRDAWNCGQYAVEFAKLIMKGLYPTQNFLEHIDVDRAEDWRPEYQMGGCSVDENGDEHRHPTMDAAMRFFDRKRRKREEKLVASMNHSMGELVAKWGS
jgi:hypothetical protein